MINIYNITMLHLNICMSKTFILRIADIFDLEIL